MNEIREKIYLGDIQDAMEYEDTVDIVFSVTDYTPPQADIHIGLDDGPENDQSKMDAAIEQAVELLNSGDSVLIHCNLGASRSVTVLAAAIAKNEDIHMEDALDEIRESRNISPHPYLKKQAYKSIGQKSPFDKYE